MSIDFHVTRADGTKDSIPVCGQETATKFFGQLAKLHGFRILVGIYPVWVREPELDQLIHELTIIRQASRAHVRANPLLDQDAREGVDARWGRVIDFVRPLAGEQDWEISIG